MYTPFYKTWWFKVILLFLVIGFVFLAVSIGPAMQKQEKIDTIHLFSITVDTVLNNPLASLSLEERKQLSEHPDFKKVHGVDDNQNMIRDDVEWYLLSTYKNPIVAGAALQYSQSIRLFMLANNSATANVVETKRRRALLCVAQAMRAVYTEDTQQQLAQADALVQDIERAEFNDRDGKRKEAFTKGTSLAQNPAIPQSPYCDVLEELVQQ